MNMKKVVFTGMTTILAATTVLAGCGKNEEPAASPSPTAAPTAAATQKPSDTPVTLKWATWQGEEDVKRIIDAFEKTHPNIKIVQEKSVAQPQWNDKLAAAIAGGTAPDVTWTFGVPTAAANGWLEDLTPYLKDDPEYQQGKTFKNLDATANYEGKQYALPHSLNMFVLFLNLDLFGKENVKVPASNWKIDDFKKAAQALTKFNDHQFGIRSADPLRETLSSNIDPKLGWNTWDGTKYNLTSPAFKTTVDTIDQLMNVDKVAVAPYKQEEKEAWYGKGKDPWIAGKLGMIYEGTWGIAGTSKNATFKWDVLPIPADQTQRVPLITDYVGIYKGSKYKKEAFEFVKWLTFSKEGWMTRVSPEWPHQSVPLLNDQEVWDAYLKRPEMPAGMKSMIALIPNGIVDPIKYLPGYEAALKIYHEGFTQVKEGKAKFVDIAPDMEKRMNATYTEAVTKLKEAAK